MRALETLAGVDIIACEDTRMTRRLTERYAISAQLKPYHEHNAALARPKILEKLAQGASIALVSDAGTPLISDPGFKLVREVCAAGHAVIAVPGASSVLAALCVAALPTDRFFFEGFLPSRRTARRARLTELSRIDATLVMFESGNRVQDTLADLAGIMGTRDAAICREMTKLHEEILRAPVAELAQARRHAGDPRRIRAGDRPAGGRAQVMTEKALDDLLRSRCSATASRMRWRMRSNCPAGRAAKSMPARSNSPKRDQEAGDGED